MTTTALQRAIGRAAARRSDSVERCGLCTAVVSAVHRHVLDGLDGSVMCACPACALLFGERASRTYKHSARETAGGDRYHLIPRGRTRLADIATDALNVPVGLAFFVRQADGQVLAHYPSPLGTTQSQVDPDAWRDLERGSPPIEAMKPRVEAYLVRISGAPGLSALAARPGRDEHWIVPVDDCFRLVAVIRRHWTGMAGGSDVWREVARFFADLDG